MSYETKTNALTDGVRGRKTAVRIERKGAARGQQYQRSTTRNKILIGATSGIYYEQGEIKYSGPSKSLLVERIPSACSSCARKGTTTTRFAPGLFAVCQYQK